MMSPQIEFLRSLIMGMRKGNEGAEKLLRNICAKAMEQAPREDLLVIAEHLCRLGDDLTRREIEKN